MGQTIQQRQLAVLRKCDEANAKRALERSQLTQDEQKTLATLPTSSEEPADVRDAVFSYLDKLRETGRTNMVVSHLIVAKQFSISAGEASTYVNAWMDKQEEQE